MAVVLYNSDGLILGAFDDPTKTQALDGQLTLIVDLTDEQLDDLFNHRVVAGKLERKAQADLDAEASARALKDLRRERDILLAQTDWWAVADRSMTPAQTAYRQALRDITNTYSSLDDVVWPTKPE